MLRVLKFPLDIIQDYINVRIPRRAAVLDVAFQNGTLCLWALCDEMDEYEERNYLIVGTGHLIDENLNDLLFVGTARLEALVFHIFQVL